jgi:pimeloyl-ACP methyl ester carboxylesterase
MVPFMSDQSPTFLDVDGIQIAFEKRAGSTPGLVWLGGWRSDMNGTKALHLDDFARRTGRAMLRHDYSGHGQSGGRLEDGSISVWVRQSLVVFKAATHGPQILIGSSMGGWIALRMMEEVLKAGSKQVAGLVLIAPAPDFTMDLIEDKLDDAHRRQLADKGYVEEKSDYLPEPNRWMRGFLDDGRNNRVMGKIIETFCPVHIIQGMRDTDVPHEHALKLAAHFPKDSITLSLVPDGDHRLSREQDLELIERAVAKMIEQVSEKAQPSL